MAALATAVFAALPVATDPLLAQGTGWLEPSPPPAIAGPERAGRALVELDGLVRLPDGAAAGPDPPEQREPRRLTRLRVVYGISGRLGPQGAWNLVVGAHSLSGEAPHRRADDQLAAAWRPKAAGLCTPAPGEACGQWRTFLELWTVGRLPVPGGRAALEGWLGWWPLGGPLSPLAEFPDLELTFNPAAPPVGGLGVRLRAGASFVYEKWAASLAGGEVRYLLGHRVRWQMPPNVEVQVTELAVATPAFAAQHEVWLPFWPLYLAQHAALAAGRPLNNEANLYMGFVTRWRVRPAGPIVSAELLVDDMPQRATDPLPYQVAFGASVTWESAGFPAAGVWRLDYRRAHRFIYTFQNPALSYIHGGLLLGYPDGPDADSLRLTWRRPATVRREVADGGFQGPGAGQLQAIGMERRRRGPGRIGEIWESWPSGADEARRQQFLSGPVEHAVLLRTEWGLATDAALEVTAGPVWNVNGESGRNGWLVGVRLRWPSR